MKKTYLMFAFICLICWPGAAAAESIIKLSDVELGLERLEGMTQYQIGGQVNTPTSALTVRFPLSELEFPLNSYLDSLKVSFNIFENLRFSLNGKMNINHSNPGAMKDSDWTDDDDPSIKTIYSESDANLEVRIWSARLAYNFLKEESYSLYAGIGYIHQDFGFNVGNTNQVSSYDEYNSGYLEGLSLIYDITYTIPWIIELGGTFNYTEKSMLGFSLGYSDYTKAEDEDIHVLTNRTSRANCDGTALLGTAKAQFYFTDNWFSNCQINYRYIEVDGESKTYTTTTNIWTHTIDQKIESEQIGISIGIGYNF